MVGKEWDRSSISLMVAMIVAQVLAIDLNMGILHIGLGGILMPIELGQEASQLV